MKPTEELIKCVQQFQSGDAGAFEPLYEQSYAYLHTCAIHLVKNEDAAQDALQDAYMEIYKNIGQLKAPEDFLNWAAVIVNHKCLARLKKEGREVFAADLSGGEETPDYLDSIAADEAFIPESILMDSEKRRLIREIIDGLSDMQRACVIGFYYNELSQEQLSEELGIPVNTVKSHLNRARAKIREAVVELDEKKGTRLYALAPFLLLFFTDEAEACGITPMPESLREMTAGQSPVRKPWKRKLEHLSMRTKIISGAAAIAAVGVAVGMVSASRHAADEPAETAVTEEVRQETEESVETVSTEELPVVAEFSLSASADGAWTDAESESESETQEPVSAEGTLQEVLVFSAEEYEGFGLAYGGVMPVKKNGLFGAVNYQKEELVPCEYSVYYAAPDNMGNFILGDAEGIYYLFDASGKLLYQGEDAVLASGGMYLTMETGGQIYELVYHSLDGNELLRVTCDAPSAKLNGFYHGISYAYHAEEYYDNFEQEPPQIGTVDLNGNVTWRDDPRYIAYREQMWQEGSFSGDFIPRNPLSTCNNGYYVLGNFYLEPGYLLMYHEDDAEAAVFHCWEFSLDAAGNLSYDERTGNESNYYKGFYLDGDYVYNYGSEMVFAIDGKDVLIDFAGNTDPDGLADVNNLVMAVYDDIEMADERYWLVQSGSQWGYIDHSGTELAMYEDAGAFYGGYAPVIEDGTAYIIDESFAKVQELGAADGVFCNGELFCVDLDGEKRFYCMKK